MRNITPQEAMQLVEKGAVRVIDVRSPQEYRDLGHIPGAELLPVDLVAVAPATVPRDDKPLLVCCEHGIRSTHAARLLDRAGFPEVLNLSGGMSAWSGPRDHAPGDPCGPLGPSSWLMENAVLLPRGGSVLDVACGRGRHALLLAVAGFEVRAVDSDAGKIAALAADAQRLGIELRAEVMDLERGDVDLDDGEHDVVLVVHYLHRPLFPALVRCLKPGGILLYETFTVDQPGPDGKGRPSNPDYLLEHGELTRLAAPLEIVNERDGEFEGRHVASVAARKRGR